MFKNGKVFRDFDVHVIISTTFIWAKKKYNIGGFSTKKKKTKKPAKMLEGILNKIPSFTFKADLLHNHIEYIQQFFYRKDANFFTKTFFNS